MIDVLNNMRKINSTNNWMRIREEKEFFFPFISDGAYIPVNFGYLSRVSRAKIINNRCPRTMHQCTRLTGKIEDR